VWAWRNTSQITRDPDVLVPFFGAIVGVGAGGDGSGFEGQTASDRPPETVGSSPGLGAIHSRMFEAAGQVNFIFTLFVLVRMPGSILPLDR
jgi:hypothetical protein